MEVKKYISRIVSQLVLLCVVAIATGCIGESKSMYIIHSKIWDVFSEDNINVSNEVYTMKEERYFFGEDVWKKKKEFEYNDLPYVFSRYDIDSELVDTLKCVLEVIRDDDTNKVVKIYEVKNISEEYMLAADIDGVFYPYINANFKHKNLSEFIEHIGPKENIKIEYVKVELITDELVNEQYIYVNNVEQLVWNLLLDTEHTNMGTTLGIKDLYEEQAPDKRGDIVICIRNVYSNMEYTAELLPNGNLVISDDRTQLYSFEYAYSVEELEVFLDNLASDYVAYKVE